jgi:hypothetical protein
MLMMAVLNVFLGGVVGRRCRVMMLAPLSVIAPLEVLLYNPPPRAWSTVAWHGGILFLLLQLGYLAGSAYSVYRDHFRAPVRSSQLEISTAAEMSGQ